MLKNDGADRMDASIEVERLVGTARGVTVEVLTCAEREKIVLAVSPTVRGMTVLAEGRLDEAEVFARVGACVLQALNDVVPLVSGQAWHAPAWRPEASMAAAKVDAVSPAVRQ